jgi:mRNA-degrading endonuclease YafQ of YafQ-DinJ toxin-antitoxin module
MNKMFDKEVQAAMKKHKLSLVKAIKFVTEAKKLEYIKAKLKGEYNGIRG